MPTFGAASLKQLSTCHPDLQRVFLRVVEVWDATIIEGKRSEAQQRIYVASGASKTLNSKHVYPLGAPSLAVDVAPYPLKWKDLPRWYAFAGFVIGTAREMGVTLRWGGDFDSDRNFDEGDSWDLPHWERV